MKYSHLTNNGNSLELEIFVKGLGFRSLHYGLWKDDQPLTVESMAEAQRLYTVRLIGLFPEKSNRVLDVGAGIGDNAIYMAEKGMNVTCISPSSSQESYFRKNILPEFENVSFIRSKFEDLETKDSFDVVLMSESSNYFPMDKGLDQTVRYLRSGGTLVMGALFRKDHRNAFEEMHVYESYLENAKDRGLVLQKDLDVTDQVIQSLELAHRIYKYVPAVTNVLIDFYKDSFGRKHWIISRLAAMLFRKEIQMGKDILLDAGPRRADPGRFREYVTYRFLTFKK